MPDISDIQFTEKMIDVINDSSRVIFMEGVTGAGKSLLATIKIYMDVMKLPRGKVTSFLLGESQTTLERSFVNNSMSLVNLFPNVAYKSSGIGGSRFEIDNGDEIKYVYLAGYSNKASQDKILGATIDGLIILDEGNRCHEDFLSELFVRLYRNNGRMIVTSNGDSPELSFYKDYMDKCQPAPKWKHTVPLSTQNYMNQVPDETGYHYYFWGFPDNPRYTKADIEALHNSVPKGSFRYKTKILGERAAQEGYAYAEYLDDRHNISYDRLISQREKITHLEIGIDVGYTAKTVFTLTAITPGHARVIVVDAYEVSTAKADARQISQEFNAWLYEKWQVWTTKIKKITVDSGAPFVRKEIENNLVFPIRVGKSRKTKAASIVKRTECIIQLLHQHRLLYTDKEGSQKLRRMMALIASDERGGIVDDQSPKLDWHDSFVYSIIAHITNLTNYERKV